MLGLTSLQWQFFSMLLDYKEHINQRGRLVPFAVVTAGGTKYDAYEKYQKTMGDDPVNLTKEIYPEYGADHRWLYGHGLLLLDDWSFVEVSALSYDKSEQAERWQDMVNAFEAQDEIRELCLDLIPLRHNLYQTLNDLKLHRMIYRIYSHDELLQVQDGAWEVRLPVAEMVAITRSYVYPSNRASDGIFHSDRLRFVLSAETKKLFLEAMYSEEVWC